MRQILLFIGTGFLFSCNQGSSSKPSYRDSVISKYFAMIDSSGKYDTADIQFKALKAYYHNDTTQLKELNDYITQQRTERPNWDLWQSDIPLPVLSQLNVDVAISFVYSIYDSPTYEVITITQKDTIRKLHYLCYTHVREGGEVLKKKEFEKSINEKDWQEVNIKLLDADYWYMKNDCKRRGDDGSDLTVIGYQKFDNTVRSHFVHRWVNSALNDAFYHIYFKMLSKEERLFGNEWAFFTPRFMQNSKRK